MGNIRFFRFRFFSLCLCNYRTYSAFKLLLQTPLDEEWYVSYITRAEAEAALRKINQVSLYSLYLCTYKY